MGTERDAFWAAFEQIDSARAARPGIAGSWSARELVAHLGYWAGWATQAIHMAEEGDLDDFDDPALDEDERNAVVARTAGAADLATIRAREQASFEALRERTEQMDPALLDLTWGPSETLATVIDASAGAHYREHAAQLAGLAQ